MNPFALRRDGVLILLSGAILSALVLAQDDPPAPPADSDVQQAAQRVWNVLEVVLDHHLAPPARQQMLLSGLRALPEPMNDNGDFDRLLGRRVSELKSRPEIESLLAAEIASAARRSGRSIKELELLVIHAALAAVPGGARFTPAAEAAVQQQFLENRYVGIGIRLAVVDGRPVMESVFPRGPAQRSGARFGDIMLSIDGADTRELPLVDVVAKLRGQAGVPVTLELRQPDSSEIRKLTIVRGEAPKDTVEGVELDSDQQWKYRMVDESRIAYLKITAIRGSTIGELRQAARTLHSDPPRAVILDLRATESGELRHAAMVADILLDERTIGSAIVRGQRREFTSDAEHLFPGLPMVVFVDASTTGQAEWIAVSLKQRPGTFLIGQNTPGYGFVVERVSTADGSTVQLRTGVLHGPDGRPLVSSDTALRNFNIPAGSTIAERRGPWLGIAPDRVANRLTADASAKAYLKEKMAEPAG